MRRAVVLLGLVACSSRAMLVGDASTTGSAGVDAALTNDAAIGSATDAGIMAPTCACDPYGWNEQRAAYVDTNFISGVIGDLNGDGTPDIVAQLGGEFDVLIAHGGSALDAPATYGDALAEQVVDELVIDVDGDGRQDVVALAPTAVELFRGNGDGTLQAPVDLIAGSFQAIAIADMTGDSIADVVLATESGTVEIAAGSGSGAFASPAFFADAPQGTDSSEVVLGDIDGDGHLDVLALRDMSNGRVAQVLFNAGSGTVRAEVDSSVGDLPSSAPGQLIDVDGDGKLDLIIGSQMMLGNGSGTFPTTLNVGIAGAQGFVTGDFNGDGYLDLLVYQYGSYDFFISLLGDGHGDFHATGPPTIAPGSVGSIAVGDFNGDGRSDLAVIDGYAEIMLAAPDGSIEAPTATALLATNDSKVTPELLAAADVDGDGHADILAIGGDTLHVFHGGCRTSSTRDDYELGGSPSAFAVSDVNHDGMPDIVTSLPNVLMNRGDGTFDVLPSTKNSSGPAAIADVDGDGNLDVVSTSAPLDDGTPFDVEFGRPDGSFVDTAQFLGPASTFALGDADGDGRADLITLIYNGTATPAVVAAHSNGDGTFAINPQWVTLGFDPIDVGDLNHDGRLDVVTAADTYLGNGDLTFGSGSPHILFSNAFELADVDGNQVPDVIGFVGGNTVMLLSGVGDGTFVEHVSTEILGGVSVLATDVNGDGIPDLLVGDEADNLRVYPSACP